MARKLGVKQCGVRLKCDSQCAIYLANIEVYDAQTKHIDVRYHTLEIYLHLDRYYMKKFIL
ncbi:putative RNA-directed DNA polymerase [Medicago truncatula]|uniref:Putative RNA-directed DNA polymerase n=1 Tax=Medicago truncatula TaxID=3880 RepID=A0A396GWY9_MEDTR|nr:putative RNA-directed DNA polymerase [Medicago truncatula]